MDMQNANVEGLLETVEVREFDDLGKAAGVLHEVLFPSRPDLEKIEGPSSVFYHVLMVLAEGSSIDSTDGDMGMTSEQVRESLAKMLADVPAPKSDAKFSRMIYNYVSHAYGAIGAHDGCIEYMPDDSGKSSKMRWVITPKGYEKLWNHVVGKLSNGASFDALGVWFSERLGLRNRSDRLTEHDLTAPTLLALVLSDHSVSTKDLRERVRGWLNPQGENVNITESDRKTNGMDSFARTFHNMLTSHKTLLKQTGVTNEGKMPLVIRTEDGKFELTPAGRSKLCRKFTTEFVAQKRQVAAVSALTTLDEEYADCSSVASYLIRRAGSFGSEELNDAARKLSVSLGEEAEMCHAKMLDLFMEMKSGGRPSQGRKP